MTSGVYRVRITPADLGRRVSVRSRIAASPEEPSATDTLGHLRRWAEGTLDIETRDGTIVTLQEADVLAARVIPEAPARRPPKAPPGYTCRDG